MPMCAHSQYAASTLDLAMALFGEEWRKGWFAMFTAYFDASGHEDGTDSLVVAGFVAPVEQWHRFDKEWQAVLDDHNVSALHMKNFAHSRGEFLSWKGKEEKRRFFLASLISVIKRRASFSFASGVDIQAFKDFKNEGRESEILSRFSSPYALGGITCIVQIAEWAMDLKIPSHDLRIIFENGDKGKGCLLDLSSEIMHMEPIFEPKGCHRAFQAADLLAYEAFLIQNKIGKLANKEKLDLDSLRKPFVSLRAMPGSRAWAFKNRQTFENALVNIKKKFSELGVKCRERYEEEELDEQGSPVTKTVVPKDSKDGDQGMGR